MQKTEIKVGGKLIIKVKEGRLFRDTETFGKMDPYCVISVKDKTFKTRVHQNGGKNPKWND
jgi:Ca2+-dependent lipid-binding protein